MKWPRLVLLITLACLLGIGLFEPVVHAEDKSTVERYKPGLGVSSVFTQGCKKFESHDFEDAVHDLSTAIKMDPKFARAYYVRACCRHLLKDYQGALADCNTAISLEPSGPIFYFERAVTESRINQLDDCIKDCDTALRLAPTFPESYICRAHAKSKKGDRDGALRDCETYLRAKPDNEQALKFKTRLLSGGWGL
ncbi:MAG: tetratricopeptide repeat protein [Candidatus Obscuribacterales bacterium]|nr:tetratricopeptide repeat protein [Candidatus Obscuribacterales bacterium]